MKVRATSVRSAADSAYQVATKTLPPSIVRGAARFYTRKTSCDAVFAADGITRYDDGPSPERRWQLSQILELL